MRKSWTAPTLALFAGAAACVLRYREQATAYDPITGLSEISTPVSMALISLTVLVLVAAAAFGAIAARGRQTPDKYRKAFYIESYGSFALSALVGLISAAAAVVFALTGGSAGGVNGVALWAFYGLALFMGLSILHTSINSYTQKRSQLVPVTSVVPALFMCYWMVLTYKVNSTNPVILEYSYVCYAFGAAAVAFYYMAGYAYGRRKAGRTIAFGLMAVYFLVMTMADSRNVWLLVIQASSAVYLAQNVCRLIGSLSPASDEGRNNKKDE